MPNNYAYSVLAEKDIRRIFFETVKRWGLDQAIKYDEGLEKTISLIAENPSIGRNRDDIKKGYRRFEYERHIIFYKQRKNDVFIIRILHDRMDVEKHI